MNKFFFIFFIQFLFFFEISAQNYKITYRHCVQYDTTKKLRDSIGLQAMLIGNRNSSSYTFGKLPENYIKAKDGKTFGDIIKTKTEVPIKITGMGIPFDEIGNILYYDKLKSKIFLREKMANEYITTEEITPIINWEITEEVKQIKTYNCKKAICSFRGRIYTAWFTTDIPIIAAPWKFAGLPGLVMQIDDLKNQVKIYAEAIEYPSKDEIVNFVNKGTNLTLDRYFTKRNEEYKKMQQNMLAMVQNQEDPNGNKVDGSKYNVIITGALYGIEIRKD